VEGPGTSSCWSCGTGVGVGGVAREEVVAPDGPVPAVGGWGRRHTVGS
jgi:hypothetical protein